MVNLGKTLRLITISTLHTGEVERNKGHTHHDLDIGRYICEVERKIITWIEGNDKQAL